MRSTVIPLRFKPHLSNTFRYQQRCSCVAPRELRHTSPSPSRRYLSSGRRPMAGEQSSDVPVIRAAPEIEFDESEELSPSQKRKLLMKRIRVAPASPAYFTSLPNFVDAYLQLSATLRRHLTLPTISAAEASRISWFPVEDFRRKYGEEVKNSSWKRIPAMLNRMKLIHPSLMPEDVQKAMDTWRRDIQPHLNRRRPALVDEFGRAEGIGRRKASSAKAWVVPGEGEILVNGRYLTDMFTRIHDRESVIWPLKMTDRVDKYNVFVTVIGGGTTGQAEAITMAIARALMVHEPLLKPALRRAGCVTRDMRVVERKKPGRLKARKRPAWVKR